MKEQVIEITFVNPAKLAGKRQKKKILKDSPTRKLMEMHRQARAYGGYLDGVGGMFTQEELKAELDTREHVPNKIESKKIRQEKAKSSRPAVKRKYLKIEKDGVTTKFSES